MNPNLPWCSTATASFFVVQVITDPTACAANGPSEPGSVVTIGAYDGVHLGHQAVIAEVRRLAADKGLRSAVVTFDRHPASVVRPESAPKLLTTLEQKLELLEATGVDVTVVVPFDHDRSSETAEEFVDEVIVGCLSARAVVVGSDFHFGKGRRGNVALLQQLGEISGFQVTGLELISVPGVDGKVSSTEIRRLVSVGDIAAVARLLGRDYELRGRVIDGDKRGRTIGFPTANVSLSDEACLPADGIYAAWYARPDGVWLPAAVNLGRRPTFYDDQPYSLLEAFLIDFQGDLYGEPARVRFVERLRPEAKFESLDGLIEQMNRDVDRARSILASAKT
jgi:riboflavin kinase / FMN adenylyltransferase